MRVVTRVFDKILNTAWFLGQKTYDFNMKLGYKAIFGYDYVCQSMKVVTSDRIPTTLPAYIRNNII